MGRKAEDRPDTGGIGTCPTTRRTARRGQRSPARVCQHAPTAWSLGYRLTPGVWGHGVATELAVAGLAAAREADPVLPVTARVLERNPASWHVLEKVGLGLVWSGVIPGEDPVAAGLRRRIYADRPLSDDLLAGLIALEQVDRRR